jgi:putative transposase
LDAVARIPRCHFPDGSFHATARGVAKMPIYRDDDDRLVFLGLLATATEKFEWTCHALCLMTNHYHLVLDATRENLSDGFQVLNGFYAQGFNGSTNDGATSSGSDSGAARSRKTSSRARAST